jgi:hypothetical protein
MIGTYYPSSKSTHNWKNMEFKKNFNSKYFSKISIFKNLLPHVNGCNVHDIQNKVVIYDIKNKNLK